MTENQNLRMLGFSYTGEKHAVCASKNAVDEESCLQYVPRLNMLGGWDYHSGGFMLESNVISKIKEIHRYR